uniref:Uncharacterized protein n=1 Tax=Equus asinus TaxID=9793 RepID=A0A9L0IHJ7_EQUAS
MRGYLVAIFLSAIFLYYVLHCISWGTSVYWAHPVEMQQRKRGQPCREKPAFASLLRFHEFHPFLCASDFKKIASLYGGDKFSLPYGIKASEEPFRLALSALQSCDLFDEFDTTRLRFMSLLSELCLAQAFLVCPSARVFPLFLLLPAHCRCH